MANPFRYIGNIDLNNRPIVRNQDGSISTVRSMSYNKNGKEILIPTVSDEGRIMGDEEAIRYWEEKGQNLGVYNSVADANQAAEQIHKQQENLYSNRGNTMADNEFNLGEALGGYEQAKADRDFYLSMVHGGTQAASPIAAYLAGVSGVKLASQRAAVQQAQDAKQAKLDARAAAEKVQKRRDALQNQLITIVKGVNEGDIPASVGATLVGPLGKELGINIKQYDAENGTLVYNEGNDPTDYEWDWRESDTSKSQRDWYKLQLAGAAEARKERQGSRSLDIQQQRANIQASRASQGKQTDPWTTFQKANSDTLEYLQLPLEDNELKEMLPRRAAIDFVAGAEELPESRKKTLGSQINRLKYLYKITPEEITVGAPRNSYEGVSDEEFLNMMPR